MYLCNKIELVCKNIDIWLVQLVFGDLDEKLGSGKIEAPSDIAW